MLKIRHSLIGSALAFLLATSCCWLPWLVLILGGAAGMASFTTLLEDFRAPMMALGTGLLAIAGWQFWKRRKPSSGVSSFQSIIICPECGFQKEETMPTDACQFFYECENCKILLRPKSGDCCVFCSSGSVPCPPIQMGGNAQECCK